MPAVKAVRKTDSRTTKKTAPKAAKKTDRWEAIERGFEQLQKVQKELGEAHKETEKTLDNAIKTLNNAIASTEKTLNDTMASTEKTLHEAMASTEKTLNKAIGGLSNTMGSLVEHIMTAGLPKKFKRFGFSFDRVTTVKWADGENNIYTELDGLLENGDQAMAVEVKTTLRNEDVDDQLERMEKVRRYADLHGDKREFLGALAAAIVDKSSREYALKKGFFVIEPSGEDVKITKPVSVKVW
jgi:flagellar hook-basal body complex protein FliE